MIIKTWSVRPVKSLQITNSWTQKRLVCELGTLERIELSKCEIIRPIISLGECKFTKHSLETSAFQTFCDYNSSIIKSSPKIFENLVQPMAKLDIPHYSFGFTASRSRGITNDINKSPQVKGQ